MRPGGLFGLSDGVFAIAMTLLALDLTVPDPGTYDTDRALRHALVPEGPNFLAFLLSFFVIASYWQRHNAVMRTVHSTHPALLRRTLPLLLMVCALPFAAGLLGTYGTRFGIAIVVYAGVNFLAVGSLLMIRYEARHHRLTPGEGSAPDNLELWFDLAALVVAAPSGYLFHSHGPVALAVILVASNTAGSYATRRRSRSATLGSIAASAASASEDQTPSADH